MAGVEGHTRHSNSQGMVISGSTLANQGDRQAVVQGLSTICQERNRTMDETGRGSQRYGG